MNNPDDKNETEPTPRTLYAYPYPMEHLSTDVLLNRLRINVGFCQFAGVSRRELLERSDLITELDKRGVRNGIIRTVAHIGYLEGMNIRFAMWFDDPNLVGFEYFDYDD